MRPKVIVLDAGGVLHNDSHLGLSDGLQELTKLSTEQLDNYQDHEKLNSGAQQLQTVFEMIAKDINEQQALTDSKPLTTEQLLEAYQADITLYPGAADMIRAFYAEGYQVVVLTNNSKEGVEHTRNLLKKAGFFHLPVYGSAEMGVAKPHVDAFAQVIQAEKITYVDCLFIDDREKNLTVAAELGMSTFAFEHPGSVAQAASEINRCREKLIKKNILRENFLPELVENEAKLTDLATATPSINWGKYPSLVGMDEKGQVIRYQPNAQKSHQVIDLPNSDGNPRKRAYFESCLAKCVIEQGRPFWADAYHKIFRLFLNDFQLKSEPSRKEKYDDYFNKIARVLTKLTLLNADDQQNLLKVKEVLTALFKEDFDLTDVSQFFYDVWLLDYGPAPLEPFVFLVNALQDSKDGKNEAAPSTTLTAKELLILQLFPEMVHDSVQREQAYYFAQPWLTCGPPQLRGRVKRTGPTQPLSISAGILQDNDPLTASLLTPAHFAAKNLFAPERSHPCAQQLQAFAGSLVGGTSGTLGRNFLMLAPLIAADLLTQKEWREYLMAFAADLVYRGHHSLEEIGVVLNQVLFPLKPWFDPLRDPVPFYEQFLTEEFIEGSVYQGFKKEMRLDVYDFEEALHSVNSTLLSN